jgi:hypothetical protein
MTVSSQTSRIEQLGDGTTTAFAVNFYFLENSDLKVFVNGVLQTITTNYTVTGAGNPAGGTVTFVSAPANGVEVVIFRDPALTQGLDYIDNDPFPAESHERGLDKLTMIAQRVKDLVSRALRLGDSVVGVNTELPALSGSQLLGTNPGGTGFQLYPLGSEPDTAANIVYTPAGTGAVATTVQNKLKQYVSVFDFMTQAQINDVVARTNLVDVTSAIQTALNSSARSIYFPSGVYRITDTILVPQFKKLFGDGMDATRFQWAGVGNVPAIHLFLSAVPAFSSDGPFNTVLQDFCVIGSLSPSSGLNAKGGILIQQNGVSLSRVGAFGFNSGGWDTLGNPATDLKYGIHTDSIVTARLEYCAAGLNDVGYLSTNEKYIADGALTTPCSTVFYNDCKSRINRTHGIKWLNSIGMVWRGGVVEANNGLVTFPIYSQNAFCNGVVEDFYSESNNRKLVSGAAGNLGIEVKKISGVGSVTARILNGNFDAGAQYCIRIDGGKDCVLVAPEFQRPISISATSTNTTILGHINATLDNTGINTNVYGYYSVMGQAPDLSGATPNVSATRYAKASPATITGFTGQSGQVITLEAQAGTIYSGANFVLKNGDTIFRPALGSISTFRKDVTSNKWVLIGHENLTAPGFFTNTSRVSVDSRDVYFVGDTNTTAITNIDNAYDGQKISIASQHTGANTTTFINVAGAGNTMKLNGAVNFTMGANDCLNLVYVKALGTWLETGRSVA